ncbi:MAG: GNAT family N-acetyltransferase [Candidatus Sulfotelmatobacter sp.]|jgi:ribosomal protein S18 acetylase RimI-like enzyme
MEFRFLSAQDAGEWWRLRLEALEGDPEAFSSSAEDHRSLSVRDVESRLGDGTTDSFVAGAFDADRLAGMAGFVREKGLKTRHKGRIWGVYVTPGRRGRGVGRKMLQMLLDRGATLGGIEMVLISVAATQESAAGLYRSLGFELFGTEPRALLVGGQYIDEQYMVLRLNPPAGV